MSEETSASSRNVALRREFVIDDLCVSQDAGALLTPLCLISESASYAARKQNLL